MSTNMTNIDNPSDKMTSSNCNQNLNKYDASDKDSINFSNDNPNAISDIFKAFSHSDSCIDTLSIDEFKSVFITLLGLTEQQAEILARAASMQFQNTDKFTQEQFKNILIYCESNLGLGQYRNDGLLYGATVQTAVNVLKEKIFDATSKRTSLSDSIKNQT